ncbi:ExbD/TolR family protein [Gemmatimonadota bacterium]
MDPQRGHKRRPPRPFPVSHGTSTLTHQDEPFIVTIDRDGQVYISETVVSPEDLASSLPQLLRAAQAEMVYIKGDSLASYGRILDVIATVARVEGIKYGLVAEPRPPGPGG